MQNPHWTTIQMQARTVLREGPTRVSFPMDQVQPWYRWLLGQVDALVGQLVRVGTCMVALLFFRVLNRTRIIGRHNIPKGRNTLLLPNHSSIIDPFFVGMNTYFPRVLWDPDVAPFFPAASEVFFGGILRRWFAYHWRCIAVHRGQRDMKALRTMIARLRSGNMVLFPEGTRSRTGELGPGRVGMGKLIHDVRPTVVPMYVHGLDKVLPVGSSLPRFGKEIRLYIGAPMELEPLLARPASKDTSRLIVDQVMRRIAEMRSRVTGETMEELLQPGREARTKEEVEKQNRRIGVAA